MALAAEKPIFIVRLVSACISHIDHHRHHHPELVSDVAVSTSVCQAVLFWPSCWADPDWWLYSSDVVLETNVLVSRRLKDKKESLGLGIGLGLEVKVLVFIGLGLEKKSWEFSRLLWVWLIAGTKNNNLGRSG